jgi:hypothetical protein
MHCKDVEALWAAHEEGALSDDMEGGLRAHLDGCPSCRVLAEKLARLEYALDALEEEPVEPPPFLLTRVMAHVAELSQRRPSLAERIAHWVTAPRLAAASLMAIAFFGGFMARDVLRRELSAAQEQKIVLQYDAPGANEVGLVGDFNDWGQRQVPIRAKRVEDRWVFEIALEPGRYQYAFVVDGKKWLPDPNSAGIIPDGFGGLNSVMYIQGEDEPRPL